MGDFTFMLIGIPPAQPLLKNECSLKNDISCMIDKFCFWATKKFQASKFLESLSKLFDYVNYPATSLPFVSKLKIISHFSKMSVSLIPDRNGDSWSAAEVQLKGSAIT